MSADVSGSEDEGGRQALRSIQVRFQLLKQAQNLIHSRKNHLASRR